MIVPVADLEVALEQVDHGQVAGRLAIGDGGSVQDQPLLYPMGMGELVDQPGLAHPRLADDGDYLAAARAGLTQDPAQMLDLRIAARKARQAAQGRGLQACPGLTRPRQLEDLDRLWEALYGNRPQRPHLDVPLGKAHGLCGQPHRPGWGQLFHSRGQVGRLAHCGVVHVEIATDRAHHDLAGIEPNADLHRHDLGPAPPLRILLYRLLHAQRGIARAHRVVLMGQGRTEESHDPVAHHLVHGALIVVHGFHHAFEHGVKDLARLFRVGRRAVPWSP